MRLNKAILHQFGVLVFFLALFNLLYEGVEMRGGWEGAREGEVRASGEKLQSHQQQLSD